MYRQETDQHKPRRSNANKAEKTKAKTELLQPSPLCRNEATRTPDPYVPNVVRYQLRYIPISNRFFRIADAKVGTFSRTAKQKRKKFSVPIKKHLLPLSVPPHFFNLAS